MIIIFGPYTYRIRSCKNTIGNQKANKTIASGKTEYYRIDEKKNI